MATYVNIYTANHAKSDGIEEYLTLFSKLCRERGIKFKVSDDLDPEAVNLIIDEFTNYIQNANIAWFKERYPQSRVVFVLTEFVEQRWGVESFNHFGGLSASAVIALFDLYFRMVRKDFGPPKFRHFFKLLCFLPVIFFHLLYYVVRSVVLTLTKRRWSSPLSLYLGDNRRLIYFHMRYLGLNASLRYADAVIASHEKIISGFPSDVGPGERPLNYLGVFYPEIDEKEVLDGLMAEKKLFMEITGSITTYRQKWINRINAQIIKLNISGTIGLCKAIPFSEAVSSKSKERGACSLHPPQSRDWLYCSPTRIYRSLTVDKNLPVITHYFNQNPIENLCFIIEGHASFFELYKIYKNYDYRRSFMEPRLNAYNVIAKSRNDVLLDKLSNLTSTSWQEF